MKWTSPEHLGCWIGPGNKYSPWTFALHPLLRISAPSRTSHFLASVVEEITDTPTAAPTPTDDDSPMPETWEAYLDFSGRS